MSWEARFWAMEPVGALKVPIFRSRNQKWKPFHHWKLNIIFAVLWVYHFYMHTLPPQLMAFEPTRLLWVLSSLTRYLEVSSLGERPWRSLRNRKIVLGVAITTWAPVFKLFSLGGQFYKSACSFMFIEQCFFELPMFFRCWWPATHGIFFARQSCGSNIKELRDFEDNLTIGSGNCWLVVWTCILFFHI